MMLTPEYQQTKEQLLGHLQELAQLAKHAGMQTLAHEFTEQRIPKLQEERFSLVVLGEFNHGKSTFVNALLGSSVLPAGITPTTATINHLVYAKTPYAKAVLLDGSVYDVDPKALQEWVTIDGANNDQVNYVEVGWPSSILAERVMLVDTPGVNDINEARAEITYQYIPQADLVLFLLDATQLLKQSERIFLEQRLLRRSKDKLIFIIGKGDLLLPEEKEQVLRYCRENLSLIVQDPVIFIVSARQALLEQTEQSGFVALLDYLKQYLSTERGRILLDNAMAEGLRLGSYLKQNFGIKQHSLQLSILELEEKIARIQKELVNKQITLQKLHQLIESEAAGLKAKIRLDIEQFTKTFCDALPSQIEQASARDLELYLQGFLQDSIKGWTEQEGEQLAGLLERLADQVIKITNENVKQALSWVGAEIGAVEFHLESEGLKYDVGLFALGALGTGLYLFVNTFVGGLLTLSAPLLGVMVRAWLSGQIKTQAREQAPLFIQKTMEEMGPRFEKLIDDVAGRLSDFVMAAGKTLYQGISEVLQQTLEERKTKSGTTEEQQQDVSIQLQKLAQIEKQLQSMRQALWI